MSGNSSHGTFDPPGDHPIGARVLVKTSGPAISQADIGTIHAVLLSHDQHPDNLDDAGREFLRAVPLVLTTAAAAERLESVAAVPLRPWRSTHLHRPGGGELKVTAVPAQHGPDGTEDIAGPVLGFVLSGDSLATVYVSGDNASLHVVDQVRQHAGPIDIAILFLGAARTPLLDAYVTLGSADAPQAAAILRRVWLSLYTTKGGCISPTLRSRSLTLSGQQAGATSSYCCNLAKASAL
jgi:L-ascorbate metabolism protein UlaG (beta-lactamase superfamily)